MNGTQANGKRNRALPIRVGAALLVVSAAAAGLASWRWERAPELLPGLPGLTYARVVDWQTDVERSTCTIDLLAEGPRDEVFNTYSELLAEAGWERIGAAGDRVNYQRGEQIARVAIRIPTVADPGWSRIRINIGPCQYPRAP